MCTRMDGALRAPGMRRVTSLKKQMQRRWRNRRTKRRDGERSGGGLTGRRKREGPAMKRRGANLKSRMRKRTTSRGETPRESRGGRREDKARKGGEETGSHIQLQCQTPQAKIVHNTTRGRYHRFLFKNRLPPGNIQR